MVNVKYIDELIRDSHCSVKEAVDGLKIFKKYSTLELLNLRFTHEEIYHYRQAKQV